MIKKPILSLVGAGPGDPELITLKGIRTLEKADVILYDALVNSELLSYAPEGCILKFVGKRYGCHTLSQSEINHLILEYAFRYGHVVRLKGGDPFIFGRAQEEIEAAEAAGIPVQVIPGISSALAVPAKHMIPLTSRGTAESFWVTTGTTMTGEISADVRLAAQSTATIVLLMAMSKIEAIMEIFSTYGKSDISVAIIQNGTNENEKIIRGEVRNIAYKAMHEGISNPAIIVIGEVVNLNADAVKKMTSVKSSSLHARNEK